MTPASASMHLQNQSERHQCACMAGCWLMTCSPSLLLRLCVCDVSCMLHGCRLITSRSAKQRLLIIQHKCKLPPASDGEQRTARRIVVPVQHLMAHLVWGPFPDKHAHLSSLLDDGGQEDSARDTVIAALQRQAGYEGSTAMAEHVVCHRDLPDGQGQGTPMQGRCCSYHCICPMHISYNTRSHNAHTGRTAGQLPSRKRRHSWVAFPTPPPIVHRNGGEAAEVDEEQLA